jgi:glycosyltransferase involved in cell wall biosynthesis
MKIALIGRYGEGDILPGPERVARELYKQLKKKNVDVTFIEYFFSGYNNYTFLNKIFGCKRNDDGVLQLGVIPLIIILLAKQYDVIHFINSQRFLLIIYFLKIFLSAKIFSTIHGVNKFELPENRRKRQFLDNLTEKFLLKKSDVIIFPSKLLREVFIKEFKRYQKKFNVIPNGVGAEFRTKKTFHSFNNEITMIFYNSFDSSVKKGLKNLLEDLSEVKNIKIKLFVIGNEEKADNSNSDLEIIFCGHMNHHDLINLSEKVQFIIKSGAFEPFSIVVAECMTMGIIPVVCENTGIKDFIENNINGFIYNSSEKGDLASLVKKIWERKYDLNMISVNAARIYEKLDWKNVSEQYISLYKSVK